MKLVLKIKPRATMTARTKDELVAQIHNRFGVISYAMGTKGIYFSLRNGGRLVYNLQKTRPKFRHGNWNNQNLTGGLPKRKIHNSVKLRDGGWTAYVYIFNDSFPIKVQQKGNKFDYSVDLHALTH